MMYMLEVAHTLTRTLTLTLALTLTLTLALALTTMYVVQVVRQNGRQMLVTILFAFMVVYVFAVIWP